LRTPGAESATIPALSVACGLMLPSAAVCAAGTGALSGLVGRRTLRRAVARFYPRFLRFAEVGVGRLRALDGSDDVVGAILLALLRGMVRAIRPKVARDALGREAEGGERAREALVPAAPSKELWQ
jgi:hypothetical protein